ncbi:MAG: sensor histidine kinase [Muribaculaceae bacterium]|nr:sensor histidine kinase [Muribaculaceae bacterium]
MESQKRLKRIEYTIYGIILLVILIAPTVSTLFHGHSLKETDFIWSDMLNSWKVVIIYVIAFIIHDQLLAPLLVYKHKMYYYVLGVVALAGVFQLYQCSTRPNDPPIIAIPIDNSVTTQPKNIEIIDTIKAPVSLNNKNNKPLPPPPMQRRDLISFILFLFGIGTNIGIKFYFIALVERKKMEELEKENLQQNLVQLRYQLHPHFFMNTLNNIHALVDIDPAKAQKCIIDLSKLMRYILYECNHEYVSAEREVEFMANYVRLMSIRHNDKLKFSAHNSDDGKGIWIPPLIFISFVENAFKHGVSYNKESYINVEANRYTSNSGEPRLHYTCRNSKQEKSKNGNKKVNEASGVGLSNIKSRLDLMFGDNYTLDIEDGEKEFKVTLDIPVKTKDPLSTYNAQLTSDKT